MKISCLPVGLLILLAGLKATGVRAGDFGPWSVDARHPAFTSSSPSAQAVPRRSLEEPTSSPFVLAFRLWTGLLTRIDGPRCSHRPSCSAFAHRAVAGYGLPLGAWLALSRLMRGTRSSAIRALPVVLMPGGSFFGDELTDYTIWRDDYYPWSGRKK